MKHNVVSEELPYYISLAQGHTVTHTESLRFSHEQRRILYGFIHVLKGKIQFEFTEDCSTIHIDKGQIVYVTKHCRYVCIYPPEETVVTVLNFDIFTGSASNFPQAVTMLSADTQRIFKSFLPISECP